MTQQYISPNLQQARALFTAEGLPFPELPPTLAGQMQPFGELLFGTRDPETGPYALDVFRDAVYEQPVTDYALLGFDGHGINSWALHYYLVQGPLALFIQLPWGGAYKMCIRDSAERDRGSPSADQVGAQRFRFGHQRRNALAVAAGVAPDEFHRQAELGQGVLKPAFDFGFAFPEQHQHPVGLLTVRAMRRVQTERQQDQQREKVCLLQGGHGADSSSGAAKAASSSSGDAPKIRKAAPNKTALTVPNAPKASAAPA